MYNILLTTVTGTTLLSLVSAFVIPPPISPNTLTTRATTPLDQLLSIVPQASSCAAAPIALECATASDALSPIIASFAKYSITTAAEQAALLSWMAYESADFKYNQNHFPAPGRPGQGTRTMMSPSFVKEYALSIPAVASSVAGRSDADVLALVQGNEYSFASAAWFYSVHCSDAVKGAVKTGSQSGWAGFVTGCVGTVVDEGSGDQSRTAYWKRAMAALYVTVS